MFQRALCVMITLGIVWSFDPDQSNGEWFATLGLLVILAWFVIDDNVEW